MPSVYLCEPELQTNGTYIWPGLEVKTSVQNKHAGEGVFATQHIPAGLVLPLVGKVLTDDEYQKLNNEQRATHIIQYRNTYIDAKLPYQGLAIFARINEPTKKAPNCMFRKNVLVVIKPLSPGTELTVWYGVDYIRDYKISNRYMECGGGYFEKLRGWPTPKKIDAWRQAIQKKVQQI